MQENNNPLTRDLLGSEVVDESFTPRIPEGVVVPSADEQLNEHGVLDNRTAEEIEKDFIAQEEKRAFDTAKNMKPEDTMAGFFQMAWPSYAHKVRNLSNKESRRLCEALVLFPFVIDNPSFKTKDAEEAFKIGLQLIKASLIMQESFALRLQDEQLNEHGVLDNRTAEEIEKDFIAQEEKRAFDTAKNMKPEDTMAGFFQMAWPSYAHKVRNLSNKESRRLCEALVLFPFVIDNPSFKTKDAEEAFKIGLQLIKASLIMQESFALRLQDEQTKKDSNVENTETKENETNG